MVINWMGPEYVMWASDFPHPDAVYPGAPAEFLGHANLDIDVLATILWQSPLDFYRLAPRFVR